MTIFQSYVLGYWNILNVLPRLDDQIRTLTECIPWLEWSANPQGVVKSQNLLLFPCCYPLSTSGSKAHNFLSTRYEHWPLITVPISIDQLTPVSIHGIKAIRYTFRTFFTLFWWHLPHPTGGNYTLLIDTPEYCYLRILAMVNKIRWVCLPDQLFTGFGSALPELDKRLPGFLFAQS